MYINANKVVLKSEAELEFIKKLIRHYDINKIREHRVLHSFTRGRRIVQKENRDSKINKEIENMINGVCLRTPKTFQAKHKPHDFRHIHQESVFSTIDMKDRTEHFYRKFAKDSLENDIYLENRYFCQY